MSQQKSRKPLYWSLILAILGSGTLVGLEVKDRIQRKPYEFDLGVYSKEVSTDPKHTPPQAELHVSVPSIIRTSETAIVSVTLRSDEPGLGTYFNPKATLASPDLTINEVRSDRPFGQDYSWQWYISAKDPGERLLHIGIEPSFNFNLGIEDFSQKHIRYDGSSVSASVTVLNPSWLSGPLLAWLGFAALVLGIISTVLNLPPIKRYFETKKNDSSQAPPLPRPNPSKAVPSQKKQGGEKRRFR